MIFLHDFSGFKFFGYNEAEKDNNFFKSKSYSHSIIIRNKPIEARRKPNGSLIPLGLPSAEKIPTKLSIRSASAKDFPGSVLGNSSPACFGR